MRFTLALLVASLLIAPGAVAEDYTPQHTEEDCPAEDMDKVHCHKDTPGVSAVTVVGLLGAVAFLARRRMQ